MLSKLLSLISVSQNTFMSYWGLTVSKLHADAVPISNYTMDCIEYVKHLGDLYFTSIYKYHHKRNTQFAMNIPKSIQFRLNISVYLNRLYATGDTDGSHSTNYACL